MVIPKQESSIVKYSQVLKLLSSSQGGIITCLFSSSWFILIFLWVSDHSHSLLNIFMSSKSSLQTWHIHNTGEIRKSRTHGPTWRYCTRDLWVPTVSKNHVFHVWKTLAKLLTAWSKRSGPMTSSTNQEIHSECEKPELFLWLCAILGQHHIKLTAWNPVRRHNQMQLNTGQTLLK